MAAQLGLDSVEELEAAIDSMEGIAEDGGEVEQDNLAREARIRAAYLDWCKKYKKEPEEERFKVFSENFLVMEKYAKDMGKEMNLNQYADMTEKEYQESQVLVKKPAATPKAAPPSPTPQASVVDEDELRKQREEERKKREEELEKAEKKRQEEKAKMIAAQLKAREAAAKEEAARRAAAAPSGRDRRRRSR